MKTNIIPCPINEKDLCSDTLFDDLFDNSEYVESEETGTSVSSVTKSQR